MPQSQFRVWLWDEVNARYHRISSLSIPDKAPQGVSQGPRTSEPKEDAQQWSRRKPGTHSVGVPSCGPYAVVSEAVLLRQDSASVRWGHTHGNHSWQWTTQLAVMLGALEVLGLPETPGEQGMAGLSPSNSGGKTQSMAGSFLGFKTDILVTTGWHLQMLKNLCWVNE